MAVRVANADETAAAELATIKRGTSSGELMRRAGVAAAKVIAERHAGGATAGVAVFTGPGNNGGDGWVVAEQLARRGLSVHVMEIGDLRSADAQNARDRAIDTGSINLSRSRSSFSLVVDALLGTGASGTPRGAVAEAIGEIATLRNAGASVVSLDLPSGVDASTGEHSRSVVADTTVSFGMMKRGHLLARDVCGDISVIDIGIEPGEAMSRLPLLIDSSWVRERVPGIMASAHKGTRKQLAIVGGGLGMAGAAILAGEGALRSGIGLLRIVVAAGNEIAIHAGLPAALVAQWPRHSDDVADVIRSVDAIAIGPGLGRSSATRDLVERILLAWSGPVVVDADALNVFAGDVLSLAQLLRGRPAAITPHPAELATLLGVTTADVLGERFEIGRDLAAQTGSAVLLKGSPTIVFDPSGDRFVSSAGTAALATGGSGDVLTGMIGTLLAQMCGGVDSPSAAEAAACAAFVHGRAAELCQGVRGVTLDDILRAMPGAWNEAPRSLPDGVLARLESRP